MKDNTPKIAWLSLLKRVSCQSCALLLLFAGSAVAQTMNIEVDYMVERDSTGTVTLSHMPKPEEIAAVVQMFACQGYTLNVVVDDEIEHINVIQDDPSDGSFFGYTGPGGFGAMKAAHFDHGAGWHYCVFGHSYQLDGDTTGSSGLAEIGGDDLIVTLGDSDVPFWRAATLAHEFGHNLGLGHCGMMNCDTVGNNPINVASIMSYDYQLFGIRSNMICQGLAPAVANLFKEMDYSHGRLCQLDESNLDERLGIGLVKVDWDCDGTVENGLVAHDIKPVADNDWCTATGGLHVLSDYNEWANISDNTLRATKQQLENLPEISCVSIDEWTAKRNADGYCAIPALVSEPCVAQQFYYAIPGTSPLELGICSFPYSGILSAQSKMPAGSYLYLRYGTYTEGGPSLVLNKRMVVTATSTAIIRPAAPVARPVAGSAR